MIHNGRRFDWFSFNIIYMMKLISIFCWIWHISIYNKFVIRLFYFIFIKFANDTIVNINWLLILLNQLYFLKSSKIQ